jgi:nucleotide-binding universal stress UspA family protein
MFEHILAPLDGSSLAECALSKTVALAKAFGSRVTFLRVLEQPSTSCLEPIDPLEWGMCKAEVRSYLEQLTDDFRNAGLQAEYALLEGQPASRILEFIQSQNVDLVVLSSHGRSGLEGWNAGSVISKIIQRSCISTMIVRAYLPDADGVQEYQRLLVPLDCSKRAECALAPAFTLARFHDSQVVIVHVVRRPELPCRTPLMQEDLDLVAQVVERNQREARKYFEQLQSRLPADVQIRLLVDDNIPIRLHELVEEEKIDLLILSAHGYSGGAKWPYGSIANSFILYGTVPLLVVQDLLPEELEITQAELSIRQTKGH